MLRHIGGQLYTTQETKIIIPVELPKEKTVYLYTVNWDTNACRYCMSKLIKADFDRRRCIACHKYMIIQGETIEDVVEARKKKNLYTFDLLNKDYTTVIL